MLDFIKKLFGGKKVEMPDMQQVGELKDKAQDMLAQHADTINNVADGLQEKIPGQADDKIIDTAQDKLNSLTENKQ